MAVGGGVPAQDDGCCSYSLNCDVDGGRGGGGQAEEGRGCCRVVRVARFVVGADGEKDGVAAVKSSHTRLRMKLVLAACDGLWVIRGNRDAARGDHDARHSVLIDGFAAAVGRWPLQLNATKPWRANYGGGLDGFRNVGKRRNLAKQAAPLAPTAAIFCAHTHVEHPRRSRKA